MSLSPAYIRTVATWAAEAAPGATAHGVLNMSHRWADIEARWEAWRQIIADTGCTYTELSEAWGCSPKAIWYAMGRSTPLPFDPHQAVHDRLLWQYGERRLSAILRGQDERTNADLAAWNRVCA